LESQKAKLLSHIEDLERHVDQVTTIMLFCLPVLIFLIKAEKVIIRYKESQGSLEPELRAREAEIDHLKAEIDEGSDQRRALALQNDSLLIEMNKLKAHMDEVMCLLEPSTLSNLHPSE